MRLWRRRSYVCPMPTGLSRPSTGRKERSDVHSDQHMAGRRGVRGLHGGHSLGAPNGACRGTMRRVRVQIPTSGRPRPIAGPGQALYFKPGKTDPSNGKPTGGLTGRHIDITVPWSNNCTIKFEGDIGPGGVAKGTSRGVGHVFATTWEVAGIMPCERYAPPAVVQAQAPAPAAPAPAPADPPPPPQEEERDPGCILDPFNVTGNCP